MRRRRMFFYIEEPTTQPTQVPLECGMELKKLEIRHQIKRQQKLRIPVMVFRFQ